MSAAPSRLGKYDIVRALGEGAMGVVYEAVDSVIERSVAIKTIRRGDLDTDEAAEHARRFLVEAKAAGKLNHPHIIGLYDHGNEDGLAYIVMERVHGRELQHWFNEGHAFGLGEVLRLMGQLLDALGYSHQRGVIHRDVKPANIFITDEGQIKLGDFGIARIESSQKTRIGTALGTPSHMAPEQIRGEAADARSDLYAAGVVLFQFLTGTRPFAGTMLSMALKVLNEPAPAPSSLRPGIPAALDAVVAKALAKNATDRYQSAAQFWQALVAAGSSVGETGFAASGFGAAWAPSGHGTAWSPSGFGDTGAGARDPATRPPVASPPPPPPPPPPRPSPSPAPPPMPGSATRHPHQPVPVAPAKEPAPVPRPVGRRPTAAETPAMPSARRGLPTSVWLAAGAAVLLLLAVASWRLRPASPAAPAAPASAPDPASTAMPPASPSASTTPAAGVPGLPAASVPAAQTAPASVPGPASMPPRTAVPDPAQPAAPAPAARPALAGSPAAPADATGRPAREPPRATPPRPTPPTSATPVPPPQAKGPRPARCSDILQKASLEPLTGEEAAYLRRECQ